jgi:hypothetical protein
MFKYVQTKENPEENQLSQYCYTAVKTGPLKQEMHTQ